MAIQISHIVICDCGSKEQFVLLTKTNIVPFNRNLEPLLASEMEEGKQIASQIRNMENIVEYNWTGRLAIDVWTKLH